MSDTPRTIDLLNKLIEEDGGLDEMNAPFVWVRLAKTLERELNAAKELIREIRDNEVNAVDEATKFLRDYPIEHNK